ncbi:MAG: hypothetical protein ACOC2U_00220, partial [bacterium]
SSQQKKEDNEEFVTLNISKNKMIIKSKSSTAWFKETLLFKYKGKRFAFSITPYLLKDILKETLECTLYSDRLTFSSDNWIYVTSLINYTE